MKLAAVKFKVETNLNLIERISVFAKAVGLEAKTRPESWFEIGFCFLFFRFCFFMCVCEVEGEVLVCERRNAILSRHFSCRFYLSVGLHPVLS